MNANHIRAFGTAVAKVVAFAETNTDGVRTDVRILIEELSSTVRSFADLAEQVGGLKTQEAFEKDLSTVQGYFRKYYYGRTNLSKGRSHCADLRRTLGRMRFKVAKALVTDLGAWDGVETAIAAITENDDRFANDYNATVVRLHKCVCRSLLIAVPAGRDHHAGSRISR